MAKKKKPVGRPPLPGGSVKVTIDLPKDLAKKLKQHMAEHEATRAVVVRAALEAYL